MDILDIILAKCNELLTLYLVFPAILLLGVYLTWQLGCVQLAKLKMSFLCLFDQKDKKEGGISHYQAVSAVLAGNFGTGNISGMAVAIATGGPGALVWMWVMAFLGASIQYASCLLGVKYREKAANGDYSGGPMYYLSNGLGLKSLAALFAGFTLFGAVTVGNFAQINSVVLPLEQAGLNPLLCALGLAILVGIVIVGGINRVARLASFIVPLKALLYLGTAWFILATHASQLLPAFKLMFQAAFTIDSTIGGIAGFTLSKALTTGFERGIFATDAGTGIVPILQSSTRASDSVENGIATLVAPFLVMVVCTTTGLVLLVTGAWQESGLQSTNMVTFAFQKGVGSAWGAYIVIGALLLFAYTTILAWACCGEKALAYLAGSRSVLYFKIFYILLIPLGAWIDVKMIWLLADIAISLMLLTNIVGIAGLAHEVIRESRRYFCQKVEILK